MGSSNNINSIHVGEYFINRCIDDKRIPTVMKILKLTYFTQGFHLALENKPFFTDEIQAWRHGPVVIELYEHLKKKRISEDSPYAIKDKSNEDEYKNVSDKFGYIQGNILKVVFKKYGRLASWHLSDITHEEDSPWDKVYKEKPKKKIDIKIIQEYFKTVIDRQSFIILLYQD